MIETLQKLVSFRQRQRFIGPPKRKGYDSLDDIDWRVEDPEDPIENSVSAGGLPIIKRVLEMIPVAPLPKSQTVFKEDLPQAA